MTETTKFIRKKLFDLKDEKYADFQAKLTPEKPRSAFIGVRTPALKGLAKELYKTLEKSEANEFLNDLPHEYFEENNLHGFIIAEIKDFNDALTALNEFLPHIDNWATCDQTLLKAFKSHESELLPFVYGWLSSEKTFVKRYAIGCFMRYYLGENFKPEYADAVAAIKTDDYYVNMMQAWYFATALCKNQKQILPYFTSGALSGFVLKKAIRKSIESFRITDEVKAFLRTL